MANAVRNAPLRQDTWLISFEFEGNNLGIWDKKDGGEVDSDDTEYYPGNMAPPISLGGRPTTGNVTLQRICDGVDDMSKLRANGLVNGAGHGEIKISTTPLDKNKKPYGSPLVYHGTLKRVTFPSVDSESGSAAMIEIECKITGFPQVI